MAEQQAGTSMQALPVSTCEHPKAVGQRWGDPISTERQTELQLLEERQKAWIATSDAERGDSVFNGVYLTGADVYWLASRIPVPHGVLSTIPVMTQLHLEGANLHHAHLEGASLNGVHLQGAVLFMAHLGSATLSNAHMENVNAFCAQLEGANLLNACLNGINLVFARLQGASLQGANLENAQLGGATLDRNTHLNNARLNRAWLDQVDFGGASLTVVNWDEVRSLGEDASARWPNDQKGQSKVRSAKIEAFHTAIRSNRQLANALQSQGIGEHADRFAYSAQVLQRQLLWIEAGLPYWGIWTLAVETLKLRLPRTLLFLDKPQKLGRWLFSWLLSLLAGYGYKPGRTLAWYLLTVVSFMYGYLLVTHGGVSLFGLNEPPGTHPLHWYEALVLSLASFHGRGFFPQGISLGDPVAILAACEAVIGLFVEISFIATFTQRYFGGK